MLKDTAEIRKSVAPMVKQIVAELLKEYPSPQVIIPKPDPVEVIVKVDTQELMALMNKKMSEIVQAVKIDLPVPEVHVNAPEKQRISGQVQVKEMEHLTKRFDKMSSDLQGVVSETLRKNTDMIAKTIVAAQIQSEKKRENEVVKVKVMDQIIPMSAVGGGRTDSDRIWLRERYTWITVSGTQVPSRVEKWNSTHKLTEDYEYDSNANAVIKSRSLEPLETFGG